MATNPVNPRLRPDLKVSQLDAGLFELSDPRSEATLRLDSAGYLLLEQFENGDQTVQEARNKLREQFGLDLAESQLLEFLKRADTLGFLVQPLEACGIGVQDTAGAKDELVLDGRLAALEELEELRKKRFRVLFLALTPKRIAIALTALILFVFPWKFSVKGMLKIKPYRQAIVRCEVSGRITEVTVREGDAVSKGMVLARLTGFGPDLERKQSEIDKVKAELERLKKGATKPEINRAEKKLALARNVYEQSRAKMERYAELEKKGLISRHDLDEAVADQEVKFRALEESEAELDLVRKETRREVVEAKEAELHALLVDLRLLEKLERLSTLMAPMDGIVATPDTQQLVGKQLAPGDMVLDIADPSRLTVEILISEQDLAYVRPGGRLVFKVQALPERTFEGKVSRIAPVAEFVNDSGGGTIGHFFRVYADLENPSLQLKPGMTGMSQISAGSRMFGLIWFRGIIRQLRVKYVV